MIQVEESEPMTLGDARVTADCIVLIRDPDNQYDVEGRGGVIKELRHDGFHSYERQYDSEQRCDWEPGRHIVLQHLQQVDYKHKDLVV